MPPGARSGAAARSVFVSGDHHLQQQARPSPAPAAPQASKPEDEVVAPKKDVQFARMSPEHIQLLSKCKIWAKLKSDNLHSVTRENVSELVNVLIQSDATGEDVEEVDKDDLMQLTKLPDLGQLTEKDIIQMVVDADQDNSGRVSVTELHKAITEGSMAFALLRKSLQGKKEQKPNTCSKKELVDFMEDEYDTKSALFSLPSTFTTFLCFFIIVTHHLRVRNAFMMQEAVQGSIEGEGKPYLQEYVHDIRSFWEWMESSGVGVLFKNELDEWPYPGRMESFNQIIGGVQFVKHDIVAKQPCDQASELNFFYDSVDGQCHRGETEDVSRFLFYQQLNSELIEEVMHIKDEHWLSQNTSSMDMTILFYNGYLKMFTMMDLHVTFEYDGVGRRDGLMQKVFYMESFLADAYYNWWILILDLAFLCFLLRMFYDETTEIWTSMSAGLDGFIQYWEVWNIIDWISIVAGFIMMGMWTRLVLTISGPFREQIAALPTAMLDQEVLSRRAYLPFADIESMLSVDDFNMQILDLHSAGKDIASLHRTYRIVIFFYALVLMLRFFKAFRANPRLNIVIETMLEATTDLVHFSVVFTVIFLVFSLMGCVAFGARIEAFSDQFRAVVISWRILMGEDITEDMEIVDRWLARFWVFIFTILVLLILLNMLLAIIMDKYALVSCKSNDPATIWRQAADAVYDLRVTRGHVDLFKVIVRLTDPDSTAFQGSNVTVRSLRRAFEKEHMTRANAEYLISRTQEFMESKGEGTDLGILDAVRIIGVVQVMVRKILASTSDLQKGVGELVRRPVEQRLDAILAGFDPESHMMEPKMSMNPSPTQANIIAGSGNDSSPKEAKLDTPVNRRGFSPEKQALNFAASNAGPKKVAPIPPAVNVPELAAMQLDGLPSQEFSSMHTEDHTLAIMSTIADTLTRIEQRVEQLQTRQDFMEKSVGGINKKLEGTERILKNLNDAVSGFNWKSLADLPEQMHKEMRAAAMVVATATYPLDEGGEEDPLPYNFSRSGSPKRRNSLGGNFSLGPSASQMRSEVNSSVDGPPPPPDLVPPRIARAPFQRRIEQCILKVDTQLEALMNHAEDATNSRQILWQIELTLRKMTLASEAAHKELYNATDKLEKFVQNQGRGLQRGMRPSERQLSKSMRPSLGPTEEEAPGRLSSIDSSDTLGAAMPRMTVSSTVTSGASQAAEPEFSLPHRPNH